MSRKSAFVTVDLVLAAIQAVAPEIKRRLTNGDTKRPHLSVVVLDPGMELDSSPTDEDMVLLRRHFLNGVLCSNPPSDCVAEESNTSAWSHPFHKFAMAKAMLSARLGMNTREAMEDYPAFIRAGEPVMAGGVWHRGIIVGVSGVQPELDEEFALMIAKEIARYVDGLVRECRAAGELFAPAPAPTPSS